MMTYNQDTKSYESTNQLVGYVNNLIRDISPEEEAYLKKLNDEIVRIKFIEKTISNRTQMSRSEINRFFSSDDTISKIKDVFHERNARAYAVRQIRKLGLDKDIPSRKFLQHQISSLKNHAIKNKNPWLEGGPKTL